MKQTTKTQRNIIIIGLGSLLSTFITFSWTFYKAYFSPSKQIIIDINSVGEAHIEFVILTLMVLVVPFSLILIFNKLLEGEK